MTASRSAAAEQTRPPRWSPRLRRGVAAVSLVLAVGAGLVVHSFLPDTAMTDIAGDALYAVAVYLAVVVVAPRWSSLIAGGIALAWCVGVELFQLTGIPLSVGAGFPPAMLVLGTVFDARDLLVYVITIVLVALDDAVLTTLLSRRR